MHRDTTEASGRGEALEGKVKITLRLGSPRKVLFLALGLQGYTEYAYVEQHVYAYVYTYIHHIMSEAQTSGYHRFVTTEGGAFQYQKLRWRVPECAERVPYGLRLRLRMRLCLSSGLLVIPVVSERLDLLILTLEHRWILSF